MKRLFLACLIVFPFSAQAADVIPPACTNDKAKWGFNVYLNGLYKNKAMALGPRCIWFGWGTTDFQFAGFASIKDAEKGALRGCERLLRKTGSPSGLCRIYMRNDEVVGDPAVAENPALSKTQFGLAIAAYGRKDYGTAFRIMKDLAGQGSADAQLQLVGMYQFGRGVARNIGEAEFWLKKAATLGDQSAQLALNLVNVRGWPRDFNEQLEWTREKAEQGFVAAQSSLGRIYGSRKDWANAIEWHTKAAEQGFGRSQYALGLIHGRGLGTPRDYVRGYMWLSLSVSNLPPGGWRDLAIEYRNSGATVMTSAQLAEARELAARWEPKSVPTQPKAIARKKNAESKPPSAPPAPLKQSRPTPELVTALQNLLAALGFQLGPIDGVMGSRTRQAIEKFESRNGLPVTGQATEKLLSQLAEALRTARVVREDETPKPRRQSVASGSGFSVSSKGHVLTNAHVVKKCDSIDVRTADGADYPALLVGADNTHDLALLKISTTLETARFATDRLRTGQEIVVVGYPLPGLLSIEPNVTNGIISSLAGIRGEPTWLRITAPVQSGNSGGPLLNQKGRVVGVVVAKLNAIRVANITGDIPQNINFAINVGVARAFLDSRNVPYELGSESVDKTTVQIFADARQFTVMVICFQ